MIIPLKYFKKINAVVSKRIQTSRDGEQSTVIMSLQTIDDINAAFMNVGYRWHTYPDGDAVDPSISEELSNLLRKYDINKAACDIGPFL